MLPEEFIHEIEAYTGKNYYNLCKRLLRTYFVWCEECERRPGRKYRARDVHHKDGNRKNNTHTNFEYLCKTHHNNKHGKKKPHDTCPLTLAQYTEAMILRERYKWSFPQLAEKYSLTYKRMKYWLEKYKKKSRRVRPYSTGSE